MSTAELTDVAAPAARSADAAPGELGCHALPPPHRRATVPRIAAVLRDLALAFVVYLAYAQVRDRHGVSTAGAAEQARGNGFWVAHLEAALHLDAERGLQDHVLGHPGLVRLLNGWYGGAHFAVTATVVVALLVAGGRRWHAWLRVLLLATLVGVAVAAVLPTAPPRLLPPPAGLVDTLDVFGGFWSYDDGSLEHIADPFAAMPSLHLVWASWCALVLWQVTARRVVRAAAVLYPTVTALVVVATGNHFVLDAVAGVAVTALAAGVLRRPLPFGPRLRRRTRQLRSSPRG